MIDNNSFKARIQLCKMRGIINSLLPDITTNGIIEPRANPNHDKIGRFAKAAPKMSKSEKVRVSSAILTDHPKYKAGETHGKFHWQYYYRFEVREPGNYHFCKRIKIEGNQELIKKIEKGVDK